MSEFLADLFTFRSPEHYKWFLATIVMLGATVLLLIIEAAVRRFREPPLGYFFMEYLASMFGLMHLATSLHAIFNQIWPHVPERVMSADCIWYNALMSGTYLLIFFLAPRLRKRPTRQETSD